MARPSLSVYAQEQCGLRAAPGKGGRNTSSTARRLVPDDPPGGVGLARR
ncbi:hypothetical protein QCN29_12665 [Streptomyces sp. HNM0663]|uniref:Uncharacterized protein n=1 Tax=Streptomyces chengmaiensis TaxID=3040919 RepID=A0ABT6HLZ4_9ACTN|nr:hypothetical protein [Streptomyces chengmaiensis]MDH2389630.1 hypothetical protein [Streptomyces chengmaiensis]